MAAQLSSQTTKQMAVFDTETVVIDRRTTTGTAGQFTYSTIYNGSGDLQVTGGSEYLNPAGTADIADAILCIDPDTNGNLPSVNVGDRATISGAVFNVVNVGLWSFQPKHLELFLKRAPLEQRPRAR